MAATARFVCLHFCRPIGCTSSALLPTSHTQQLATSMTATSTSHCCLSRSNACSAVSQSVRAVWSTPAHHWGKCTHQSMREN